MTVDELRADLSKLPGDEQIVVVMEDNPNGDGDSFEDLEPGAVLDISEAGGFVAGMRVIRAYPRQ